MEFKVKVGVHCVRLALGVVAGTAMITAQAQSTEEKSVQRVEITGSNIKRVDKEGTSPIQTLTAKEIARSGAATVLDLLKTIPSMGTGGFNDTPNQNGFSRGVATASLRGLGSTSTLILLNGRRMAPSAYANPNNGQSTLYDLNSIPLSAIERVEVFKDGASAVYGSDAIAGVINFITKRDYQGGEISANYSANDDKQFGRKNLNGVIGFGDFQSQGFNIMATVDLKKQDAVSMRDGSKDIEAQLYSDIAYRAIPYGSSVTASSPFFYKEKAPNSKAFYNTAADGKYVLNALNCPASEQLVGGLQYNIQPASVLTGRKFCNYDTDQFVDVQSRGEDANFMSVANFKINENLTGFAELAFSDTKRYYRAAPRTISGTSPTTNFLVGGLAEPFQPILPIGHPDNPFTDARAAVAYRFENVRGGSEVENKAIRLTTGVKGSFGNWDYETAVLWNRSRRDETTFGMLYLPTLRTLITQNRSLASLAADPTVGVNVTDRGTTNILQWDAKASTEFGSLPGGAIGFAAGIEFRQEKLTLDADPINARGDILGLATTQISSKRNVSSAFFELRTPLLKNFEMDFAGRVDKYPSLSYNFVPKVGAKWTVNNTLAFRGSYAKAFRAPALSQVAAGGVQSFLSGVADPVRCPDGKTPLAGAEQGDCSKSLSSVSGANPDLKPEKAKSFALGMIWSPTSNFDMLIDAYKLRQEGEIALSGATYLLEHANLFPADSIVRDTNQFNLLKDANGNPIQGTGPLISVKRPWVNQGATEVSGLDTEFRLRNNLGEMGKLSSALRTTYLISYRRAEKPGDLERNAVGTIGGLNDWTTSVGPIPRLRFTLSSSWEKGPHSVFGNVKYTDSVSALRRYDNDKTYTTAFCHYAGSLPAGVSTTFVNQPNYLKYFPDCEVPSWTTVDLGYTYTGYKGWTLGVTVANVLDSKAPYYPESTLNVIQQGYNSSLHNNTGRYFTFSAKYVFK